MRVALATATLVLLIAHARAGSYRLEEIPLPRELSPEISAVGFTPGGALVVANRHGEIWVLQPADRGWRRFASGLHEPMGIHVVSDSEVFVGQRPELTR